MDEKKQIQKLVDTFIDAAKKHHAALSIGKSSIANKQAKRINKAFQGVQILGTPARKALLEQINNENPSVAIMIAAYSLKYNTELSLQTLRKHSNNSGLIGFQAEQAIKRWEEGTWQIE